MRSRLSVLGLYNYNEKLFELLQVPSGVEKDLVIDRILMTCAEYEVLFPSWDYMHYIIGRWSRMRADVWERLYRTTQYEYDPIYNYNRYEEWTDEREGQSAGTSKSTAAETGSATDEQTSNGSASGSEEDSTAGFNTDEPKLHDVKDVSSSTETTTGRTAETSADRTESGSTTGEESEQSKHVGRLYGNIGVTTTQALIDEERRVSEFNMYNYIADDFAKEFCLLVY